MTSAKFETVAQANAGANATRPDTGDDDIIANVLGQIEETRAEPEVQNIFAPDVDEALRPMTRPIPVHSTGRTAEDVFGMDATIDLSLWQADPTRKPRVILGFDTEKDRVLLLIDDADALPELQVKRTKDGIPVLCRGNARLLVLPGMSGSCGIEALVLDVT